MRVRFIVSTVLALGLGLGLALPTYSEDGKAAPPDEQKPVPELQELHKLAGDWDVVIKEYQEAGKPPSETKGSATFKVILGGNYVSQDFNGSMMGMKYTGHGFEGYDASRKKYVSVWADSMNPSPMLMDGESTDGGKTITYLWSMPGNEEAGTMKLVHIQKSADEFQFQIYMVMGKEEMLGVDMTYTRKKK